MKADVFFNESFIEEELKLVKEYLEFFPKKFFIYAKSNKEKEEEVCEALFHIKRKYKKEQFDFPFFINSRGINIVKSDSLSALIKIYLRSMWNFHLKII